MLGAVREFIEATTAFLPTDVTLVHPGPDQPVALLECPAGGTHHDRESVANHLTHAFRSV